MRLAAVAVLFALVSACLAEEVKKETAAAPVEAAPAAKEQPAKASRAADAPVYQRAQNRDGAHHHHHHDHPAPINTGYASAPAAYDAAPAAPAYAQAAPAAPAYDAPAAQAYAQPAPAPQAYAPAPAAYDAAPAAQSYDAAPAAPAYAPAPAAYDAAPAAPAGAYEAAPAANYGTSTHQGYYYYYYPVKDSKAKLKLPKLPRLPSLPSLRLPEYIGKEGGGLAFKSIGAAAAAAAVVATGVFLSLPIIGLGAAGRSFSSIWENEYLTRDNLNTLAEFILNTIDNYKENHQN